MIIPVKLEAFEGPLDLLLHLIDQNKIDIYDIPVSEITDQYLAYVAKMQDRDLDTMSDFLLMAATLLDIKSRMLVPKDEIAGEDEEDPREELARRLLEHKLYRYMSGRLKELELDCEGRAFKGESVPKEVAGYRPPPNLDELLSGVTLLRLREVFKEVLRRGADKIDTEKAGFGKVEKDEITVEEKIGTLKKYLGGHKRFSFSRVLGAQKSRIHVIVTFLAVLEMARTGEIRISQENINDDIIISDARLGEGATSPGTAPAPSDIGEDGGM